MVQRFNAAVALGLNIGLDRCEVSQTAPKAVRLLGIVGSEIMSTPAQPDTAAWLV
jgi:hypothetical protein